MRYIVLLISLGLMACSSKRSDNNTLNPDENEVVFKLPVIELPFSKACGDDLTIPVLDIAKTEIIADFPDNLKFAGLLKSNDDFSAIMLADTYADYQVHYLTTISKDGQIIDQLNLVGAGCSEDETFWKEAKYIIDNDLNIHLSDSSATYRRDENGELIQETIKSQSHKKKFSIDQTGKIKINGT